MNDTQSILRQLLDLKKEIEEFYAKNGIDCRAGIFSSEKGELAALTALYPVTNIAIKKAYLILISRAGGLLSYHAVVGNTADMESQGRDIYYKNLVLVRDLCQAGLDLIVHKAQGDALACKRELESCCTIYAEGAFQALIRTPSDGVMYGILFTDGVGVFLLFYHGDADCVWGHVITIRVARRPTCQDPSGDFLAALRSFAEEGRRRTGNFIISGLTVTGDSLRLLIKDPISAVQPANQNPRVKLNKEAVRDQKQPGTTDQESQPATTQKENTMTAQVYRNGQEEITIQGKTLTITGPYRTVLMVTDTYVEGKIDWNPKGLPTKSFVALTPCQGLYKTINVAEVRGVGLFVQVPFGGVTTYAYVNTNERPVGPEIQVTHGEDLREAASDAHSLLSAIVFDSTNRYDKFAIEELAHEAWALLHLSLTEAECDAGSRRTNGLIYNIALNKAPLKR